MEGCIVTERLISEVSRPVSWGEMDLLGHLNNVHYFRYIEDARVAFLNHYERFDQGLYRVILKNECEYLRPVIYPDHLTTRSYVTHVGNTSFIMMYEVFSMQQQGLVAIGKSVIVMVDPISFEKRSIPHEMREKLIHYMQEFKQHGK